LLISA